MGRKRQGKEEDRNPERETEREGDRESKDGHVDQVDGKRKKRYSNGQGDRDGGWLAMVGSMVEDGRVLHCPLTCC